MSFQAAIPTLTPTPGLAAPTPAPPTPTPTTAPTVVLTWAVIVLTIQLQARRQASLQLSRRLGVDEDISQAPDQNAAPLGPHLGLFGRGLGRIRVRNPFSPSDASGPFC